jgi:hypothetical protein
MMIITLLFFSTIAEEEEILNRIHQLKDDLNYLEKAKSKILKKIELNHSLFNFNLSFNQYEKKFNFYFMRFFKSREAK